MSTADDFCRKPPHIAFFPSAGMGHLTPFLRLAAMLASRNCTVTLITVKPTVSAAESANISAFFSAHPHINRLEFEIPPTDSTIDDPFFKQFEAINRSIHLFKPLLSSFSPPLNAIFSDFALATSVGSITEDLCIPNYVFGITSARFFSLMASLPSLISDNSAKLEIPGFDPSNIPSPMFNPNHFFTLGILSNAPFLPKAKGMLLNTFDEFESETIAAFNNGRVLSCLPPLHPIGPLEPYELEKGPRLPWLDNQIVGSVIYIGFGNKTALSKDQIRELGNGLEISGCPFLWVLKTKKVDTDDNEELQEVLEESFLERTKNKGIVVKEWVKQEEILAHPAIGGFLSHCGWNSVMDAARHGVPVLAWPHGGDQKVTAEVVERAGLAVWVREWGWGGERLVRGEEIGEKVREMMSDRGLRNRAREIGEEARKAWEVNGSSEKALMGLIDELKP